MFVSFSRLVCVLAFWTSFAARAAEVPVAFESFQSGGRRIGLDHFQPADGKSRATLLVLHGAGGTLLDGPEMRRVARSLAEAGNDVFLVHYFNRTGNLFARDATMQRNFETWLNTVRDAVTFAETRSGTGRPIGIYGYSLGAFLAVAAASDNPQVGAVVEQAGGVWNNQTKRIGRMPPLLVMHGRIDTRVPFEKYAAPLLKVLRERGGPVETRFFAQEGHGFSPAAMKEVKSVAAEFFSRRVGAAIKEPVKRKEDAGR